MAAKTTSSRFLGALWCLLVPTLVVAAYLGVALIAVGQVRSAIGGTLTANVVAALLVLAARLLRPRWFAYPRPGARGPWGVCASGLLALAFVAGAATSYWLLSLGGQEAFERTVAAREAAGVVLTLVLALVVAPIAEEALFRGVVYPLLRRRVGVAVSALVSSVAFAVLHGNPVQFVLALPLGIVLALMYERGRKLWPCIVGHAAVNLVSMFASGVIAALTSPVVVAALLGAFGLALWRWSPVLAARPGGTAAPSVDG